MWFIRKKKDTVFIIVVIGSKAYDYPEDMPIPRIGEQVRIENAIGIVEAVKHSQYGTFKEVLIETSTCK